MGLFSDLWNAIQSETAYNGEWGPSIFPAWWPDGFRQQMANFHNICNTGPGAVPGMTVNDFNAWIANSWFMCMTSKTMGDRMQCPPGWDCTEWDQWETNWFTHNQPSQWDWNLYIMSAYVTCLLRIDALWPGHADEVWIYFYYMYDTDFGKLMVDEFIYNNSPPDALVTVLKANYIEDTQREYGILNMPNLNTVLNYYSQYGETGYFSPAPGQTTEAIGFNANMGPTAMGMMRMHTILETEAFNRLGNPTWTVAQRKTAYDLLLSPKATKSLAVMKGYWDFYIKAGWFQPGAPDPSDPTDPVPPTPVQDPKFSAGKPNPTTNVDYMGMLPYAPKPRLWHQRVWHSKDTDPDAKQVCVPHKGPLEKIIPVIGGVFGAGIGVVFMPDGYSRLAAATTLGTFGYFYLANAYGWDALQAREWGMEGSGSIAAIALSVGAPVTAALFLEGLDILPDTINPGRVPLSIFAGVMGYLFLEPILEPVLSAVGTLSVYLSAPIAWTERVVGAFTDGCVESYLHGDCLCQDANMKSKLAESLTTEIYGATGKQATMRVACLRNQMLKGDWGIDIEQIGLCDPTYSVMSNPAACLDASMWTDFNIPTDDQLAYGMWQDISPCLDATNPVFLPPRDIDIKCADLGPHFRLIDGQCIDYGVDHPDPSLKTH